MKQIVCERNGEKVQFSYRWPVFLQDISGITTAEFQASTAELGDADGDLFLYSRMSKRNITITALIKEDYEGTRQRLYSFFQPRIPGILHFNENGNLRKIQYYPESVQIGCTGRVREVNISLVCPDPMFQDENETIVIMSGDVSLLKFPFIYGPPIKVANTIQEQIVTVNNPTNITTGLKITFEAERLVQNPGLEELSRGKGFSLPFTVGGQNEYAIVTTGRGEKSVKVYDPGAVRNTTKWNIGDDWIQLEPGDNIFRYTATSGLEFLRVKLNYSLRYWGA